MKRISGKKLIKWLVQQNYTCYILLVAIISYVKNKMSLKVLLVDIEANSSILMKLEMAGMTQNKQKCLMFIVVSRVKVKNQISRIS